MNTDIPNEPDNYPPPVELAARRQQPARVPPHDLAAEASLLGACLIPSLVGDTAQPSPAIDAAHAHGITSRDFYRPTHGHIWQAVADIHEAGGVPDPVTVADQLRRSGLLDTCGGPEALVGLQTGTPSRSNAGNYARIVDDLARLRTIIGHAAELAELGYSQPDNVPVAEARATQLLSFKPRPVETAYHDLDDFLAVEEEPYEWVIPGLLERSDRTIITANAGTGKSTLIRQMLLMAAGGLHPFTLADIPPLNVLLLDVENSPRQVRRAIRILRNHLGTRLEPQRFTLRIFGAPTPLADPATLTELCRAVEQHQPDIIGCGPLYKLIHGDPTAEEPARETAGAFDKLRHVCGSALLIEAHSPYAAGGKTKREIRPYGASLWERWPEYGWHFTAAGDIEHWRGQREEREWPAALERSHPWPWAARREERVEGEPWHGPTRCIEAVVEFLAANPEEELSGTKLYERLRVFNAKNGFREKTVREAAEAAAADPDRPVTVRNGTRGARIYSYRRTDLNYDTGEMF